MLARVSDIETFRLWRQGDDPVEALVERIVSREPTEAMRVGTAFHKVLERARVGDVLMAEEADGFTFHMPDGMLSLPPVREIRSSKDYGDLTVTGKADYIAGRIIGDHKTRGGPFDAEQYLAGYQWRFYLDIFNGTEFRWTVFEIREVGPCEYGVSLPHHLHTHRYPGLHDDCARLAADYLEFAKAHMPDTDALYEDVRREICWGSG